MIDFRKFLPLTATCQDFARNTGLSLSFIHKMTMDGRLPGTEAGGRRLVLVAPALRAIGIDPETLLPLHTGPRKALKVTPVMKAREAAAAAGSPPDAPPRRKPGRPRKVPVLAGEV